MVQPNEILQEDLTQVLFLIEITFKRGVYIPMNENFSDNKSTDVADS